MLAPLIVFAYNRADHLQRTLTALSENAEAKNSDLFVFIDGPKNDTGIEKNKAVFEVAKSFSIGSFKRVEIINSKKNKGLAKSVILGVSEIINKYGKVIVTEDDAVCSPNYLKFMNGALDFYEKDTSVWSVGGFTVPMTLPSYYNKDIIKTQRVSSCAWGTWKDRWTQIDWDMPDYKKFRFDFISRFKFNKWGKDRSSMLDDQMNGRVNSWAIRFDYYMYKNKMFNIIPRETLIRNIGFDGSGTHCKSTCDKLDHYGEIGNSITEYNFCELDVDKRIKKEFCKNFKVSLKNNIKRFMGNLLYRKK